MFLSKLRLRTDVPLTAILPTLMRGDAGEGVGSKHRLLWVTQADGPDRRRDFLWRETARHQYVTLSARPPQDPHAMFEIDARPFDPVFRAGQTLQFVLRANANVRSTILGPEDKGKREDILIRAIRELLTEEPNATPERKREVRRQAALHWLKRQGEAKGFNVLSDAFVLGDNAFVKVPRGRGRRPMQFSTMDVGGLLVVADPEAFKAGLTQGYGSCRAFGCGLMMVQAPRPFPD